jgi:hypothetical protein
LRDFRKKYATTCGTAPNIADGNLFHRGKWQPAAPIRIIHTDLRPRPGPAQNHRQTGRDSYLPPPPAATLLANPKIFFHHQLPLLNKFLMAYMVECKSAYHRRTRPPAIAYLIYYTLCRLKILQKKAKNFFPLTLAFPTIHDLYLSVSLSMGTFNFRFIPAY